MRRTALAALAVVVLGAAATTAQADVIRLQSTTDVNDSGLYPDVIQPGYAMAQPGDSITASFVGTGAALTNAKAGLADVVVTHAPSLEAQFVAQGYSNEPLGRAIFYNDYIIVGPKTDPANVLGLAHHDAVLALQTIAARGAGASHDVTFVSRGDNSGTNVQEQILWGLSSVSPKQLACNGAGDPARYEPGTSCPSGYPAWYKKSNLGQAANLAATNTCAAASFPQGGCYTMLDRGTWIHHVGDSPNLKIVSELNTAGAIGGQTLQTNYFHAYVLNPAKTYPNGITPNAVAGQRFVNYLVASGTQGQIAGYPNAGAPGFHPDAVPTATFTAPAHAASGTVVTVTATLKYAAPPNPVLPNMPNVQLQQSTNGGTTWTNVAGQVATTNASGVATFHPTVTTTTLYRVTTPTYDNSSLGIASRFTAGTPAGNVKVTVP